MLNKSDIKYIQSLRQKKFRDEENLFIVEGPKIVQEALTAQNVSVKRVLGLDEWMKIHNNLATQTEITTIDEVELQRISLLKTPNKVLALVEIPWRSGFSLEKNKLAIALDGIQDPGNMGAIIRIADWFGITQIICSKDSADIYNPKVVQATMGSIFRVEIFYTELAEWLLLQNDVPIIAATLDGTSLHNYKSVKNGILIIGNESKGIRNEIMPSVSEKITIEKYGDAESLNAAVATGIILSHLKR
jgi:RNA methyltransferase, TrmH family